MSNCSEKVRVSEVAVGDVFTLSAGDRTVWVATEISGYSNGDAIVYANGPTPGVTAVFTLAFGAYVYLEI
jgi:hypothetical protein